MGMLNTCDQRQHQSRPRQGRVPSPSERKQPWKAGKRMKLSRTPLAAWSHPPWDVSGSGDKVNRPGSRAMVSGGSPRTGPGPALPRERPAGSCSGRGAGTVAEAGGRAWTLLRPLGKMWPFFEASSISPRTASLPVAYSNGPCRRQTTLPQEKVQPHSTRGQGSK